MAGAPCELLWEHGTGPSPQVHLTTLTRDPAPVGGCQPECPRPMGAHGLEQKALRFTLVVLLSSYCLCVCEGLSFPGTGRGAEQGAGRRKFRSPLALKLGPVQFTQEVTHTKGPDGSQPHTQKTQIRVHLCQERSCPRAFALPSTWCTVTPDGNLPLLPPQLFSYSVISYSVISYSDVTSQPRLLFHLTLLPSPGFSHL